MITRVFVFLIVLSFTSCAVQKDTKISANKNTIIQGVHSAPPFLQYTLTLEVLNPIQLDSLILDQYQKSVLVSYYNTNTKLGSTLKPSLFEPGKYILTFKMEDTSRLDMVENIQMVYTVNKKKRILKIPVNRSQEKTLK